MSEDIQSQNQAPHLNFMEQIFVRGLELVMSASNKDVASGIRKDIYREYPDIVLSRLEHLNFEIQCKIIEGVYQENPDVFIESEDWWAYINRSISKLSAQAPREFFEGTGLYVLLNRIKDLREEVDWYKIFIQLSDATIELGHACQGFMTVLGWLVQFDSENLRKIIYRTESKSYPGSVKTTLYKQVVDLGLLDVKIARRIRSDSSGSLSSEILSHLFENRSVYSDDVFQDLVTQFSDTKHKWVARYIAINMPMHLVPFLMGIKDDTALKILEKRMEVFENSGGE